MKGAGKVSTVVAAILCTASIAAAYNAEAIFFDIASDTDSTCAFYDLPCKRGIYIEARDSWVPVAQEAGTYHQMLQMWGVCTYDPMLCQAAEADVNELSYLLMLIEDAILANS